MEKVTKMVRKSRGDSGAQIQMEDQQRKSLLCWA